MGLNPRAWSAGDVVAGVTVAATSLPQYIAYAELAALAGHRGISTAAPPLVVFSVVTGSPSLVVGLTSITALMSEAALGGHEYREANGEAAWTDLLGAFAVLVGAASLLFAVTGVANLAKNIPGSVKAGWKLGFALTVVASQAAGAFFSKGSQYAKVNCSLPQVGGGKLAGGAANMYRLGWTLLSPGHWSLDTVLIASLTFVIVMYGKQILTSALGRELLPGLEVVLATIAVTIFSLFMNYDGSIVGLPPEVPTSGDRATDLASLLLDAAAGWVWKWPWDLPFAAVVDRLSGWITATATVFAFAAVDFLAIISVEDAAPPKGGWSPTREMAGQGVASLASGIAGSGPVGGSLSRSLVATLVGASSPLTGLVCGIATLCLARPEVATLLAPVPKALLAAIVLAAVLPGVVRPKDVLKLRGGDAVVAWVTALSSVATDPTVGFAVGMGAFGLVWVVAGRRQKKE